MRENLTTVAPMSAVERRSVLALASVIASRMLGLFLLLPVLAVYAANMPGSTPMLIGLAVGAYGLTQALFQLPFGIASDRFGRKRVITLGLFVFVVGSVVAALADTMTGLIIGRAIQGAGAVSSAVLALTADLTQEEQRTKAMALLGMSIGAMFLISMAMAPPLTRFIGVDGLFWLTTGLGFLALLLLHACVPTPSRHLRHRDVTPTIERMKCVLRDSQLLRLNLGIFILHLALTGLFVVLPFDLSRMGALPLHDHWKIYVPVIVFSVIGMAPLLILRSRADSATRFFRIAISVLLVGVSGLLLLQLADSLPFVWLPLFLWIFFSGFNALEAMLPALVSRVAPAADKGTAIGFFNTFQFIGVFVGGTLAGGLSGQFGSASVYLLCLLLVLVWLGIALGAPSFRLSSSRVVRIGNPSDHSHVEALIDKLRSIRGVQEVTVVHGEALAYLKVDDRELDVAALKQLN